MSGSQSELPVPNNYLITVFLRQSRTADENRNMFSTADTQSRNRQISGGGGGGGGVNSAELCDRNHHSATSLGSKWTDDVDNLKDYPPHR